MSQLALKQRAVCWESGTITPLLVGLHLPFFLHLTNDIVTLKIFLSYSLKPSTSTPIPALKSGNTFAPVKVKSLSRGFVSFFLTGQNVCIQACMFFQSIPHNKRVEWHDKGARLLCHVLTSKLKGSSDPVNCFLNPTCSRDIWVYP